MFSKRYESTVVYCTTRLHVHSGTLWPTSYDTHQEVKIQKDTSPKMYTSF